MFAKTASLQTPIDTCVKYDLLCQLKILQMKLIIVTYKLGDTLNRILNHGFCVNINLHTAKDGYYHLKNDLNFFSSANSNVVNAIMNRLPPENIKRNKLAD